MIQVNNIITDKYGNKFKIDLILGSMIRYHNVVQSICSCIYYMISVDALQEKIETKYFKIDQGY